VGARSRERTLSNPREAPDLEPVALPKWIGISFAAGVALIALARSWSAVYAFVALLTLAFLSCYRRAPEHTMLVFIVFFPTMMLFPTSGAILPGINFETLVIFALAFAASAVRTDVPRFPQSNPMLAPVVFYTCVMVVSGMISFVTGRTGHGLWDLLSDVKSYVFVPFVAPLAFRLLWTPRLLRSAVNLIAWVTAIVSVHAMLLLPMKLPQFAKFGNRAVGIMGWQPNALGAFLALMIVILFSIVLSGRATVRQRALWASSLVAAGVALLATMSRGSWLGALAGLCYLGVARGAKVGVLLLLLAISAVFWIPQEVLDRAESTVQRDEGVFERDSTVEPSTRVRLVQWKTLAGLWAGSPLVGHGFRTYGKLFQPYDPYGEARSAHSSIIEFLVEEGLVGFAAYCWLIGALGWAGWRVSRTSDDPFLAALGAGLVAATICLVLLDTSGTRFRNVSTMVYIWLLGGALARVAWATSPPPERRPVAGRAAAARRPQPAAGRR